MAHRKVEVGEMVRLRHGLHKGKLGKVTAHERRKTGYGRHFNTKTMLTYVVKIENAGPRRVPGSYLDLKE